ncbi:MULTISPECIES: hypothetical protein [unclassified Geomicrobium]|uniref:hypothetical protein n=1 Tax=unclassified Geomicrobium TaxID=2628951 RepID=UPI00045ED93A|nr:MULTISPECIES: hypothetical protein [unclassified Geomicrobium]GAJ97287.1 hypothetical protein JCM19055_134 [Geomicrobium sp. JCM 19055]GAK07006.1 hypothetical protein JCM19038_723 [Geomicrobium sp. JCM 19038]
MRQPYHLWNPKRDWIRDGGYYHSNHCSQLPFEIVINNNLINGPGVVTTPQTNPIVF